MGLDPHKSELQEDSAEGAFRFCQHLIEESTWGSQAAKWVPGVPVRSKIDGTTTKMIQKVGW